MSYHTNYTHEDYMRHTKHFLLLLFTLVAFTARAQAIDVAIGPSTIPGFNAANLPSDVSVLNVAVTFNNSTVTCSNCFRQEWVGLGGFRIAINGVAYTVNSVASKSSLTLTTNYAGGDSSSATVIWYKYVELRIYADSAFQPLGKTYIVQSGAPNSGAWHKRAAASVVTESGTNNLYIPQIVLDSTTDSPTNQSARYYAAFYRPGGSFIQVYECFDSFSLRPTGTTTWPDICLANQQQVIAQDNSVYTKTQIDAMRTGCTMGQMLYYAVTGLKPDCLIVGAGLQIIGNTLSATAGTSYQTILNNGTPLTQRTALNFLAPSFVPTDNGGTLRTDITLDSDLNALASTATTGLYAITGIGASTPRTLQAPAAGFSITNPGGVGGNPIFALTNNLAALEAISTTGLIAQTGADTVAPRTLQQPAAGIAITNPAGIAGDPTFALADDLAAVEGLSTNGFTTRTAASTWATRTITGTANEVTVTNGDGVSGPPTLSLPTSLNFVGKTITGTPAILGHQRAVNVDTSTVGNVGAGVDTLHTYTLASNSLTSNNDYLEIEYGGTFAANDNNKRLQITFDGQNIFDTGSFDFDGAGANGQWAITLTIIRVSSTSIRTMARVMLGQATADGASTFAGNMVLSGRNGTFTVSNLGSTAVVITLSAEGTADNDAVANASIVRLTQR